MEDKWFRKTFHSLTIFMMQIKWFGRNGSFIHLSLVFMIINMIKTICN